MNRVLLDTVGLLALWNARDQWHGRATTAISDLRRRDDDFYTTSYILLECGNDAARKPYRTDLVVLRRQFISDGKLIEPTDIDCATAWTAFANSRAGGPGIVDEVSFAVMRRLGITDAFTNDRHFQAAGFNILF